MLVAFIIICFIIAVIYIGGFILGGILHYSMKAAEKEGYFDDEDKKD